MPSKMTEADLASAFAGESQAHMRYLIFAQAAENEFPNLARLFRAVAFAEQVHASNHFKALGMVRAATENLDQAIQGETYEVEEMYPAYFEVARLQKEKEAQRSFHYALEAEKLHAGLYQEAKAVVDVGQDVALGLIYICPVCGHTVVGEPPQRCPICAEPGESFMKF